MKIQSFSDIITNSSSGISNMKKIRDTYGIKCVWIPRKLGAKDISDYHKKYGRKKTLELIKTVLLWLNREKKLS